MFIGLVFLVACSKFLGGSTLKIGIDPTWFYTYVGKKAFLVNGFIQEVLLEISKESGVQFEFYEESWDNLFQKLNRKDYDFIVSGLMELGAVKELYYFSDPLLKTGPILVVPKKSDANGLDDLKNRIVSFEKGSYAMMILQKYPTIQLQPEPSAPVALNQIIMNKTQGALIDALIAYDYVDDLYEDSLKVLGEPCGPQAIRWICLQNKHSIVCQKMQKAVHRLKERGIYQKILKKWSLR